MKSHMLSASSVTVFSSAEFSLTAEFVEYTGAPFGEEYSELRVIIVKEYVAVISILVTFKGGQTIRCADHISTCQ